MNLSLQREKNDSLLPFEEAGSCVHLRFGLLVDAVVGGALCQLEADVLQHDGRVETFEALEALYTIIMS